MATLFFDAEYLING